MDYRRLIKFGNSSYVISLPKDWLKKNHLEKGDTVYLTENTSNEVVLSSKMDGTEPEPLTVTLNVDDLSYRDIQRRIISKYIAGADVFILQGEKTIRKEQEVLRQLLNNLMALEVIEQSKIKIIAKDFLNPAEISFKTMVRRVDTILRSMFDDAKSSSKEDSLELTKRDEDINRLSYLILRTIRKCILRPQLAKKMDSTVETLLFYRELVECMERIADELKRISRALTSAKTSAKQIQDFYSLYDLVYKLYIETMKAHYNHDEPLAYKLAEQREVLLEKATEIGRTFQDPHLFLALEKLKTTIVLIRDILRLLYRG